MATLHCEFAIPALRSSYASSIHDCLRAHPRHALAAYLASMLVLALAEHIADAAGIRSARRH